MKSPFTVLAAIAVMWCSPPMAITQGGTCGGIAAGQLNSLNGFVPFPNGNLWNTDISLARVDPNSSNIINFIGPGVSLHADFGSGTYHGQTMGIPYQVVSGAEPKVNVKLGAYAGESDPGPMPVPPDALIEGYPQPGDGDRHVLVLEKDGCRLYELYHANLRNGVWSADAAAVWDLTSNAQRPYAWTSADAAGLPIFPGLARYDEVAAGAIQHALRFTVPATRQAFTPPASHWASGVISPHAPPMGMRLRLKAGFDISGFSAQNQVILSALKKYGMILADNGRGMYLSGAPDSHWNNRDLRQLAKLTASDFEVVLMSPIYTGADVPRGPPPTVASFQANPASVAAGRPVTLRWSAAGAAYNIITPQVGPVRGNSITVTPSATITYTLYSTNQHGRTKASVMVTVH